MIGSVVKSLVRFSGSRQPRVRIVPAPVSGRLTRIAVMLALVFENAASSVTRGVPLMRTGAVSGLVT